MREWLPEPRRRKLQRKNTALSRLPNEEEASGTIHASVLLVSSFLPSHARSFQAEAGGMGTLDVVRVRSALEQRAGWRRGSQG